MMFLAIPNYGFGQQEFTMGEAQKGYVSLSLGMSEGIVVEKLKGFQVTRVGDSNSYVISIKTKDSKGDVNKVLGSIAFTNKKLSYISRRWYESYNNKQTFELADKLYHLLKEELGGKGEVKATVKAASSHDPEKEVKGVHVTIGKKRISLLITESEKVDYGLQVSVTEEASNEPFKY